MKEKCFELIDAQRGTDEGQKVYWLGDQLKEIVEETPGAAELVAADLQVKGMGLQDLEKKVAEYAKEHGGCCPYKPAGKIIREFYGLGSEEDTAAPPPKPRGKVIDLAELL